MSSEMAKRLYKFHLDQFRETSRFPDVLMASEVRGALKTLDKPYYTVTDVRDVCTKLGFREAGWRPAQMMRLLRKKKPLVIDDEILTQLADKFAAMVTDEHHPLYKYVWIDGRILRARPNNTFITCTFLKEMGEHRLVRTLSRVPNPIFFQSERI